MKVTLALKLAVIFSVLIFTAMAGYTLVIWQSQQRLLNQQVNAFGSTLATQWAASVMDPLFTDDFFEIQVLLNNLINREAILGAAVFNDDAVVVVADGRLPELVLSNLMASSSLMDALEEEEVAPVASVQFSDKDKPLLAFIAPVAFRGVKAGDALIVISRQQVEEAFNNHLKALVGVGLLAFVSLVLIARYVSRAMARPITDMVQAADAIGKGDYTVYITEHRTDELGDIQAALNRSARNLMQKEQVERVLARLVDNDIAESLLESPDAMSIGSQEIEASVVFVDIVGFTSMSERMHSAEVVTLLNQFFDGVAQMSHAFSGTIDKYIGDCAMVLFGVPKQNPLHALQSLRFSRAVVLLMEKLNRYREFKQMPPIKVRVGVNCGYLMAGIIGAPNRMEYTVIGDVVNLASRLGGLGPEGEILASESSVMHSSIQGHRVKIDAWETLAVKGKEVPVQSYMVRRLGHADEAKIRETVDTYIHELEVLGQPGESSGGKMTLETNSEK